MRKSIYILVAIFMAATMVLTSCGPAATTVAPATCVPPKVTRSSAPDRCPDAISCGHCWIPAPQ